MRIYTNITAFTANRQLSKADENSAKSILRLSSGYRINRSEDDSVGMAISNKLKMQLKSLERAQRNTADGISIVQTAEGTLSEVHAMLQRMDELAVQSANDANTSDDRSNIQKEITQISAEINRICRDTDFNGRPLLDGSLSRKAYADNVNGVKQMQITDGVRTGKYRIVLTGEPEKAAYTGTGITAATVPAGAGGMFSINGMTLTISEGESITSVYEKMASAANMAGVTMKSASGMGVVGEAITFEQDNYGSRYKINLSCSSANLAAYLGFGEKVSVDGKDTGVRAEATEKGFADTVRVESNGEVLRFSDKSNFEMIIRVEQGTYSRYKDAANIAKIDYNVTNAGAMTIQMGSSEGQTIDIDIPLISTETLDIDNLSMYTHESSTFAISRIGRAIDRISTIRSNLGAYQNRMEHTIASTEITSENMTSALSRISDINMAEEMTTYTTQSVLAQAATSMLAQANQAPEKVLQLLQ